MPQRRHIPIMNKCLAARDQLREMGITARARRGDEPLTSYLEKGLLPVLEEVLGSSQLQLDHDPALGLREVVDDEWVPHQHNPKYLRFRPADAHLEKTVGRKPGAERTVTTKGSDIWKMKKFRRLEGPKKRKRRIMSKPFPKTKRGF